ncbi:MAG: SpoIIE family protein phosphatase [Ignavibacteriales bacterium]|nr:SpoIIE family protein phosphatase [Ignavibacteriales bacterium]
MNEDLKKIVEFVECSNNLSGEEKDILIKATKSVDRELTITLFKLDRTEKVKRTTGILLEETIEELEQKRKAVEEQAKLIQIENERKSVELEEARQLQLAMLPKVLPNLPNLDIAVYMQTATEVGGDYYDFHVEEEGTLTAVIGDATGHGLKAGTIVTITKSLFNSLASNENILETFSKISKVIKDMKFSQLAMCLMMIKIKGNELSLSSAAMPPALIYKKKKNLVEEIESKGMPLGTFNNFPYSLMETNMSKGDTILLMSDGLPELMNSKNEMYGYDRTKTEFHLVGEKEPEEIVEHLKNSASEWVDGKDPDDDVTFVVIKIK